MNEEEKKAVENIKELKTLFEIDDKKDFEATPLVQKEIAKDLKTLLNLIDKMKNCINILDDELKERNKTINEKEIIIEKLQKENEEWREAYQEEKDKQFELIQNTNNTIKTAVIAIEDLQKKLKEVIPIQKVKDKIEELKQEKKKYGNCLIEMYEDELVNRNIKILQELLESEK